MGKAKFDFTGEVAVVTGSATGIGRTTAESFAKAGAKVAICDINEEEAKATVELCKAAGGEAKFYPLNVTAEADEIAKVRDEILSDFGRIDILHSNAGIAQTKLGPPYENIPFEEWSRVFGVNLFGSVKVCQEFAKPMRAQKSGKIVLTASIAAYMPGPVLPVYSASKQATINYAQSLAEELGNYNINVNVLNPGFVYTPIYSTGGAMKIREKIPALQACPDGESVITAMSASQSALKRAQTSEDMANAVMFLCSEESKEITGQALNVDSGNIMR